MNLGSIPGFYWGKCHQPVFKKKKKKETPDRNN
jgi:hypothetical protein